jgi:hypothetical protein
MLFNDVFANYKYVVLNGMVDNEFGNGIMDQQHTLVNTVMNSGLLGFSDFVHHLIF